MALGAPARALDALTGIPRAAAADPEIMALLGMAYLDSGAAAPATEAQDQISSASP